MLRPRDLKQARDFCLLQGRRSLTHGGGFNRRTAVLLRTKFDACEKVRCTLLVVANEVHVVSEL
jgi:hypothetical protein